MVAFYDLVTKVDVFWSSMYIPLNKRFNFTKQPANHPGNHWLQPLGCPLNFQKSSISSPWKKNLALRIIGPSKTDRFDS